MKQKLFPLFVDLTGMKIVVVGGGNVALRKINRLIEYAPDITVITLEVCCADLWKIQKGHPQQLKIIIGTPDFKQDLASAQLVIAATDNPKFNQDVVSWCYQHGKLVNNATSKTDMNMAFACCTEYNDSLIAIYSHGNPKKSQQIKKTLTKTSA